MNGSSILAPFRERNFRLFYTGQFISMIGTWLQFVAEGWLVFSLTHSATWLGIVAGAAAAPGLLLSLAGGQAADRFPRRTILLVTQSLSMVLAFLLALLASGKWVAIEPWHLAALAAALGAVNGFAGPAFQSFLPTLVPREQMGSAIALNSLLWNSARVIGPLVAGSLIAWLGATACFSLNGLSYVGVLIALALMRVNEQHTEEAVRMGGGHSALEGLRYVARTPVALRILILFAVTASFGWLYQTLLPALASEQFHRGADGVGQLTAAAGIGAVLAALITAFAKGPLRRWFIYGGACSYAVGLLIFSGVRTYPAALATLVFVGCGLIICGVNINAQLQEEVPDALRGRVMAIFSLIWMGFQPLGGLLGGPLAQAVGSATAVRVGAGVCLVTALSLLAWSQAERRGAAETALIREPAPDPAPPVGASAQL